MNTNLNINGTMWRRFELDTTGTGKIVMMALLRHMEKDTNIVAPSGDTLKRLSKETELSDSQIRNKLTELKKLCLIESTGTRAEYIVNPLLATKGNEGSIWETYGKVEQTLGNSAATVERARIINVKAGKLTDTDYKAIGKYYVESIIKETR